MSPAKGAAAGLHTVRGSKITKKRGMDGKERRKTLWDYVGLTRLFGSAHLEEKDGDSDGETIPDCDTPLPSTEIVKDEVLITGEGFVEEGTQHIVKDFNDRYLDYDDPRIADWSQEEIWLFNKLASRGSEALLHWEWNLDFPTFPDILFTSIPDEVFINNRSVSLGNGKQSFSICFISFANESSAAARALTKLISTGSHVRAQLVTDTAPEKPLLREIAAYHRWALADGKLQRKAYIPIVAIAAAKPKEPIESIVDRITDQLHSLCRQYRDKWRHTDCDEEDEEQRYSHELPTLFGFVIKHSIMAIVTCDASMPSKPIRTLGTFDWQISGHDVWHSLAVAITIIRARDYLMRLDAEGELGPEGDVMESDPDA